MGRTLEEVLVELPEERRRKIDKLAEGIAQKVNARVEVVSRSVSIEESQIPPELWDDFYTFIDGRSYPVIDGKPRFWKFDVKEFLHVRSGGKTILELWDMHTNKD
jgi:hypothetical protein